MSGLVTYPQKNPLTEHGRKLGPAGYLAPEMRDSADTADPGPADVWALAKTLWVLLTSQALPLPGTHWHAGAAHALAQRISFGSAAELDLLLEQAAKIDPQARPSMGRQGTRTAGLHGRAARDIQPGKPGATERPRRSPHRCRPPVCLRRPGPPGTAPTRRGASLSR